MMKVWSFYDVATGLFSGRRTGAPTWEHVAAQMREGEAAWPGSVDHREFQIAKDDEGNDALVQRSGGERPLTSQ